MLAIGSRQGFWDKSLQSERTNLYLPAFPVAAWIVENWWSLLNELCPADRVPKVPIGGLQRKWIKRHCLRSADSALLLPALYLFNDGQSLRAEWQSDSPDSLRNMPGEFITDGAEPLDIAAARASLANFIDESLNRVAQVDDQRVRDMREQWQAIQNADSEEQQFCSLAGRMGIDPYDPAEMTEELSRFFERTITRPEDSMVCDLTEVAHSETIVQQWSWVTKVCDELKIESNPDRLSFEFPAQRISPPMFGYELAGVARTIANVPPNTPLESVEAVAEAITGRRFRIEDRNHAPGLGIRAIVGQSGGDIISVGPKPRHPNSHRFLTARSLYHALVTTRNSQRLVTDAFSWDQKASRAFAAELLAPQRALADLVPASGADSDAIESLSRQFKTSTIVIENQLENAGIALSGE